MTVDDLKQNISKMSTSDLMERINDIRKNRRTPIGSKKKVVKEKKSLATNIKGMSNEDLLELIKLLEEKK